MTIILYRNWLPLINSGYYDGLRTVCILLISFHSGIIMMCGYIDLATLEGLRDS